MSTQPAIEAAKIAAEAAAKNTEKTFLIAIITALVSLLSVLLAAYISSKSSASTHELTKDLGEQNLKSLEQRRYIDAISTERVKWINTIRERFSEFIKLSYLQMADFSYWKHKFPEKIGEKAEKELINRFHDITYASVQIILLLNPKEIISDRIDNLQNDIKSKLNSIHDIDKFNFEELANLAEELIYLHQVVLKSEWKRVKEENKIGEEIDDDAMNDIYKNVAKKLDKDLYNKYLNQLEEKAL
ncbi:hypothetical protein OCA08_03200 [Bacillus cereus]|nr:hypothetical protein [Bacillus cereus]